MNVFACWMVDWITSCRHSHTCADHTGRHSGDSRGWEPAQHSSAHSRCPCRTSSHLLSASWSPSPTSPPENTATQPPSTPLHTQRPKLDSTLSFCQLFCSICWNETFLKWKSQTRRNVLLLLTLGEICSAMLLTNMDHRGEMSYFNICNNRRDCPWKMVWPTVVVAKTYLSLPKVKVHTTVFLLCSNKPYWNDAFFGHVSCDRVSFGRLFNSGLSVTKNDNLQNFIDPTCS